MIRRAGNCFVLSTSGVSYAFHVTETGHLEHLYFGTDLGWSPETPDAAIEADCAAMAEKRIFEAGNMIAYDPEHKQVNLENMCLEMSAWGKGDIRDPFVTVRHGDGSCTSDFLFADAEITEGEKPPLEGLPSAYGTGEQLRVTLRDRQYDLRLELVYSLFSGSGVLCRSARIWNDSQSDVTLERLLSCQLDMPDSGYVLTLFHGAWAREMDRENIPVGHGRVVSSSATGSSSNRNNPFVMLHRPETTETTGICYGMNLVYSGNHYAAAQVNAYGKTRFVSGLNPEGFSFRLEPGESFQAPEAVMAFSAQGFGGMSREMHRFVLEHIVRGVWRDRPRPVLLNSWEAVYFHVNESKLLRLGKAAKDVGVELMVLDDGWFAQRDDDLHSLGDWDVNTKKFPGGLTGVAEKLRGMGLDFGLWVEPEMVNEDSRLFQEHPDWTLAIPGKPHAQGRNQRVLDLCNPAVVEHLIERISGVLSSARISYVKWDMNRIFSDVYSPYLPEDRQGETAHRYMLGFYRLLETLTQRFPEVLFEGCASGGNRFDLGALCYFPQIWASDNTDAISRAAIQEGYSYGYPMCTVTAHVSSCPNHQTLRQTPLDTRFAVACFGVLGYECNLADMTKSQKEAIQAQIALYKQWRTVLQNGTFYRLEQGNHHKWLCVSPDRKKAVGMVLQELVKPNTQYLDFRAVGLDPDLRYHFYSLPHKLDIRAFGDLVNTISPVHIRQNSVAHNTLARFVSMPGETEDLHVSGRVLMEAGVKLSPAYSGTGYNEKTRYFQDFSSRLYFMEAE